MGAKYGKAMREGELKSAAGLQRKEEQSFPRVVQESGGSTVKPGMRGSIRPRSVSLNADLDNERTYAVEPQEIIVKHLEGEPLGGHFLGIDALDLPGMPELDVPAVSLPYESEPAGCKPDPLSDGSIGLVGGDLRVCTSGDSDVSVAVLLSIEPDSPIARFGADHPGVLTVGTVVLQATTVSETATRLTIGRWGWSIVLQKDPAVPRFLHPGAMIEAYHRSFARIGNILSRGSARKGWNRKNPMAAVRTGDCVIAVNGVPVWRWLENVGDANADDKLNEFFRDAGERQEWVVVRLPGSKPATGNLVIAELIQETLSSPAPSNGSDGSLRNKAFRESLSLGESESSLSTVAFSGSDLHSGRSALSITTDMESGDAARAEPWGKTEPLSNYQV